MLQYKLKNPLTKEERLQVPRLFAHDAYSYLATLMGMPIGSKDIDKNKYDSIIEHIGKIQWTIHNLTVIDEMGLYINDGSTRMDSDNFYYAGERINNILRKSSLETQLEEVELFLTDSYLIHSVLFNLVKNAVRAQKGTRDQSSPVSLIVNSYNGFPEEALFIPESAKKYEKFIEMKVKNKGRSFPEDVSLESYFSERIPERFEDGFGLYFIKLASKFLRAPVNITSEPRNTEVTMYHPVYVDKKDK